MADWGDIVLPDLSDTGGLIVEATRQAYRDAAERVPERITEHLDAGRKPDGTAQPQNAPSTLRSKRREGQGDTPGVATGTMSDPTRWRVQHQRDRSVVSPPPEREDVIEYLDAKDYEFVGVPEEFERDLDEALDRRLGRLK